MGGGEHPDVLAVGQRLREAGDRLGSDATVEQQDRVSFAAFVEGDVDVGVAGNRDGVQSRDLIVSRAGQIS
jgi:hypothetical protein